MDIKQLASKIFKSEPKGEYSIMIDFEDLSKVQYLFEALMLLFTEGMKIKFGVNGTVNLDSIKYEDILVFKRYFKSIGVEFNWHKFTHDNFTNLKCDDEFPYIKPTQNLFTHFKSVKSNIISDYKYQLKRDNKIYVIYFNML